MRQILLREFQVRNVAVNLRDNARVPSRHSDHWLATMSRFPSRRYWISSPLHPPRCFSSASSSAMGRGNSVLSNSCDVFPSASAAAEPIQSFHASGPEADNSVKAPNHGSGMCESLQQCSRICLRLRVRHGCVLCELGAKNGSLNPMEWRTPQLLSTYASFRRRNSPVGARPAGRRGGESNYPGH